MSDKNWNGVIWEGVYQSFEESLGEKGVFYDSIWINKQTEQLKEKLALLEREKSIGISSLAQSNDYYLSSILATQYESHEKTVSVLDFGGGLAGTYLDAINVLPKGMSLRYVIVENEKICEIGSELFKENGQLEFSSQLPIEDHFDTIHAGSSIHYVDDWLGLLKSFCGYQPKYLIFVDLPAGDIETFVAIQNYYGKKIPVWFWNLDEFINEVNALGYNLIAKYRYANEYVKTMCGYDKNHKLSHFSQLIFRINDN